MPKIQHLAFCTTYNGLTNTLSNDVTVVCPIKKNGNIYKAIWDTGATHSVITPKVFNELGLFAIDRTLVHGVNSCEEVDVSIVEILLPNHITVKNHRVTVCDIAGGDLLIGMDIITIGDFSISNRDGKTEFSFAIPPFQNRTNLLEKAEKINGHKK